MHAGALLCAKALQAMKRDKEAKAHRDWLDAQDNNTLDGEIDDSRWPLGQPDTYSIEMKDGVEEVRICAGSPIGEVAFFSGDLQRTVRFMSCRVTENGRIS